MEYTPGDSKKDIGINVLAMCNAVALSYADGDNSCIKNKRKRDFLDFNPKISECVGTVSKYLPSPEVRPYAVVRTEHVLHGKCTVNAGKIQSVSGLHSLKNAQEQNLLYPNQYVFIGQDNHTIGILLGNRFAKSMKSDITEENAIAAFQQGKTVAKFRDTSNFKMSQISDDSFVGSYHDAKNPAICSTVYPLLIVDGTDEILNKKQIYVGKFSRLDANGNLIKRSFSGNEVYVTPSQFQAMMNGGKQLTVSKDYEGFHVSNITDQMWYSKYLLNFPSTSRSKIFLIFYEHLLL